MAPDNPLGIATSHQPPMCSSLQALTPTNFSPFLQPLFLPTPPLPLMWAQPACCFPTCLLGTLSSAERPPKLTKLASQSPLRILRGAPGPLRWPWSDQPTFPASSPLPSSLCLQHPSLVRPSVLRASAWSHFLGHTFATSILERVAVLAFALHVFIPMGDTDLFLPPTVVSPGPGTLPST